MDATRDRFEILDVKDPGIQIPIPANHVERVVIQNMFAEPVTHFDAHFKIAAFRVCFQLFGQPDIALRIGRMLKELPEFVAIAFGRLDL